MTCKDCIHYEACLRKERLIIDGINRAAQYASKFINDKIEVGCSKRENNCEFFADRSRFVELPDIGDYDTVTTIDEAIDHCYQIATSTDETVCAECKAEHMRLCGWLGNLKRRIAAEQALKEREENA